MFLPANTILVAVAALAAALARPPAASSSCNSSTHACESAAGRLVYRRVATSSAGRRLSVSGSLSGALQTLGYYSTQV